MLFAFIISYSHWLVVKMIWLEKEIIWNVNFLKFSISRFYLNWLVHGYALVHWTLKQTDIWAICLSRKMALGSHNWVHFAHRWYGGGFTLLIQFPILARVKWGGKITHIFAIPISIKPEKLQLPILLYMKHMIKEKKKRKNQAKTYKLAWHIWWVWSQYHLLQITDSCINIMYC